MAVYNFDDIQESKYIGTEGSYTLKIIKVAEDEFGNTTQVSANKNTEFHKYVCENQEHEKINVTLYITSNSMWKYRDFMKACGVDTKGFVMDTDKFDPETMVGKKFVGEVKRCAPKLNIATNEYEPSKYFEVVKFLPVQ
jgi:hypothetical protein